MMCCIFFFNDTATTEIYTLSLHDALPICRDDGVVIRDLLVVNVAARQFGFAARENLLDEGGVRDRKSTRLNSSHANISYAVFCLKKKNKNIKHVITTLQRATDTTPRNSNS